MADAFNFLAPGVGASLGAMLGGAPTASPDYASLYQSVLGRDARPDELAYQNSVGGAGLTDFYKDSAAELAGRQQAQPSSGGGLQAYQQNPALQGLYDSLSAQSNTNLQNNVLPGLNWGASAAGGYGDTRNSIANGQAVGLAQQGLDTTLGNLAYGDYNNQMNRNLQQYQGDQSYNLGLGNLANTANGQNNSFYTQNRQLDQSGAALGASLYGQGNTGLLSQGQGLYGLGTTQQTAAQTPYTNFNSAVSPYTGYGQSSTSTGSQSGSAIGGALGGAGLGYNLANQYGLNSGSPPQYTYNPTTGTYS